MGFENQRLCKRQLRSLFVSCMVCLVTALPIKMGWAAGHPPSISQTITLEPGWNAVYLRVTPNVPLQEFFREWPVPSINIYNTNALYAAQRFDVSPTEETAAPQLFATYSKNSGISTIGSKLPGDSILVCFNNSSERFVYEAKGAPVAPRIAWHKTEESDSLNYVAVSIVESATKPKLRDYFDDMKFTKVYRYGGTLEAEPKAITVLKGMDEALSDKAVFLVPSDSVSEWSGVLYVSPQMGVSFGDTYETSGLTIRNDGTEERTVTVVYDYAEDNLLRPEISILDDTIRAAPVWKVWKDPISRKLSAGESWTILLALNREQFKDEDASKTVGGILTITEDGASQMRVQVPLQAVAKRSVSTYPAGLWVATVTLNRVDRIVNKSTIHKDIPAGGTLTFRLLLHVDEHGICRLLQRVTLAGQVSEDGSLTSALYAGGVTIPSVHEVTLRYSCVTLPTDMPVIPATAGNFGNTTSGLNFNYTIGANSASNPFHHPYHPDHDGKAWDFETPLPDGIDPNAYLADTKPETFTIHGQVQLIWDEANANWKPTNSLTGTCRWGYGNKDNAGGLRHEGTLWASGRFVMEQVSTDPDLIYNKQTQAEEAQ